MGKDAILGDAENRVGDAVAVRRSLSQRHELEQWRARSELASRVEAQLNEVDRLVAEL